MKDAVPDLLRNPGTFGTLKVDGNYLLDEKSGERFLIRDGIPVLVRDGDISGLNKKYKMTRRIENVVLKRLWGDRLYIIRFQKP